MPISINAFIGRIDLPSAFTSSKVHSIYELLAKIFKIQATNEIILIKLYSNSTYNNMIVAQISITCRINTWIESINWHFGILDRVQIKLFKCNSIEH